MAAYNGYPATYQQMYPYNPFVPQIMQQPVQQPTGRMVEIVPTDSEDAATNFPVAVGATQMLMARDDSFIAVKTNGVNGQSNLIFYDKRPPAPPAPAFDPAAYIRRDEIEDVVAAVLAAHKGGAEE